MQGNKRAESLLLAGVYSKAKVVNEHCAALLAEVAGDLGLGCVSFAAKKF